ncbi:flavin reductase family protein [Parvularcula oceani]|uniref:flavin reductase family protein n=1 Tax=Parvularcula oceani TaxID=1247963 RepID=UPI00068E193C|nr:flavin reductase family protein [Parvularcula oceani]
MAQPDAHAYEPAKGHGLAHDPFNAIIAPRPIGWVSTADAGGRVNLAPYSFFNAFAYRPPIIGFASWGRKDSVENAEATGEFVWNLATRDLAEKMNATSAEVRRGEDEFALAGLERAESRLVAPPRVLASPVNFECRTTQVIRLKTSSGEDMPNWMVFGEVVMVHIDRRLIEDGVYDTARARPISRGGGPSAYYETLPGSRFDMVRPDVPAGLERGGSE